MSNHKKHIDRLFQEQLKDFEKEPDKNVWNNIQNQLQDKKQPKRVMPLWLKYASIAAILGVLLSLGTNYITSEKPTPTPIVNSKNSDTPTKHINNPSNPTPKVTLDETKTTKNQDLVNTNQPLNHVKNATTTQNNDAVTSNKAATYQNYNNTASTDSKSKRLNNTINKLPTKNNAVANTTNKNSTTTQQNTISSQPILKEDISLSDVVKPQTEVVANDSIKPSEKENSKITSDSLSIEDAIAQAQTEDSLELKTNQNKWTVNANIAPVYYNSLGKGSHIDNQFVNNPKTGEINTSYGVTVGYAITDKFSVRTGLNSLNLSYDTDNVILYESPAPTTTGYLKNIDFNNGDIQALSGNNIAAQQVGNIIGENSNAAVSQRLSYIEVPTELSYNLSNKRFGINVIGGMSTFFLTDNAVYSEFHGYKTPIGKANNINTISFSANLGFGFNYKFTKRFVFNLEPTFKYQINAYENTSGNFNPYIIGVYSGFSYKF